MGFDANDKRFLTAACALWLWAAPGAASAQDCQEDADCGEGEQCVVSDAVGIDCSPGADCGDPPEPAEVFGECEPAPIACQLDADCPAGLSCEVELACQDEPGGGETCEEADEGHCIYAPDPCEDDGDCSGGLVCQALGAESECRSAPSACRPGDSCEEPPEPECVQREVKLCFPARVDCEGDGDCGRDERCVMLPEDAQDDAPEGWDGATEVCLPEGLVLAIEGRVDVGGGLEAGEDDSSGAASAALAGNIAQETARGAGSADTDLEAGEPGAASDGQDESGEEGASGQEETSAAADDDGGCVVGGPAGSGAWAIAAALLWLGRRRRPELA